MNNNHFIDAFYRTYENVNETSQARSPEPGIKLVDDKWDAQSKRLVNDNPGVGIEEAVTTDQAMIRVNDSFKVGAKQYEFMEANRTFGAVKSERYPISVLGKPIRMPPQ